MGRGGSRAHVNGSGASLRQVTLVTRPLCSTSDAGLRAKVGQECVCVCVRGVCVCVCVCVRVCVCVGCVWGGGGGGGEVCRCLLSTIHYDY